MERPSFDKTPGFIRRPLERLLDYVESLKPVAGVGAKVFDSPGGRVICADAAPAVYAGPTHHKVSVSAVIPDPLKVIAEVTGQVSELIDSALPTSSAIAGIISGPLVNAAAAGTSPASVVNAVAALFNPAIAILDNVESFVNTAIGNFNPVAVALQNHFASPGAARPKNGDYICNDATGILYTLVKRDATGYPSGGNLFRVPFTVGSVTWVAMTLFPSPSISAVVEEIAGIVINLIKGALSTAIDAVLQAVAGGLINHFNQFGNVWDAIENLLEMLNALDDLITDPDTGLDKKVNDLGNLIENPDTGLKPILDALKEELEAAVSVSVIGKDGIERNIKVLTSASGEDMKQEITWIDSSTGAGKKATIPIITGPVDNTVNVDWREVDYISQLGDAMKVKVLTLINQGYPKEEALTGALTAKEKRVCNAGTPAKQKFLAGDVEAL